MDYFQTISVAIEVCLGKENADFTDQTFLDLKCLILAEQTSADLVTIVKKWKQECSLSTLPVAQCILHLQSLNTTVKYLYLLEVGLYAEVLFTWIMSINWEAGLQYIRRCKMTQCGCGSHWGISSFLKVKSYIMFLYVIVTTCFEKPSLKPVNIISRMDWWSWINNFGK